jgi:hypothetical protein
MAANADPFGLVVGMEMRVHHLDRVVLLEKRLVRALFAVCMTGARGVVRHGVAVLADDGFGRCAVAFAIA